MVASVANFVPRSRAIYGVYPLTGGGDMTENRTITMEPLLTGVLLGAMPEFNVMPFGAEGDGVTDDSYAFTVATEAASENNGIVNIPAGTYVIRNIPLIPGVTYRGAGSGHGFGGASATILKLPASPSPGDALFKLDTSAGEFFDGGAFEGIEFNGTRFSEATAIPFAPTTTVEADKIRGIDFRQSALITISSEDTGTETITTSAAHNFATGDVVGFDIGSGGVLATGLTGQPGYYYVNVTGATTFIPYDTKANAIAGGATGKINITAGGSGTRYVTRTTVGTTHFRISDCYFHHFDEAIRGTSIIDRYLAHYTAIKYCYVGVQGQEHPKFNECDIRYNYVGLAGRFVDWLFGATNKVNQNIYGIAPYGTNKGGSALEFNNGGTYFINNCTFGGAFYKNVYGLTIGSNNTVLQGALIAAEAADAGQYAYSNAIGVRVQGQNNQIAGTYGELTAPTSFGRAAIMFDKGGNAAATLTDNIVDGAQFNLSAGTAILGGNTNETTPLYGTGSWGSLIRCTVRNCVASLYGQRFIYWRSLSGTMQYCTFADNCVMFLTGGTSPIGGSDGIIEGSFYIGTDFLENRIYNVSGTVGSAIEQGSLAIQGVRFIGNRFDGAYSAAVIVTNGTPVSCYWKNNVGYLTENAGTATFGSGNTTLDVAHGLAQTPSIANIELTPQSDLTANGAYWISDVGASTFRINLATGSGTPAFSWRARVSA